MPAPSSSRRRSAEKAGRLAETLAALFLVAKGYRLLAQRFVARGGEIDLVTRKAGTLVFVEVKLRRTLEEARLAVTPRNAARIRAAADAYLARKALRTDLPLRYDIVAVSPRGIRHIRDAFR
ncbi:YraN family protein [Parvularcula lutaonensis]|uniref:UPF0102 protein ACFONP_06610 n=1 Tax=Parvularcula lutaonensis TaxID=491923 RepID=A0ABV7MAF8_9PROT|nr:YraN family protein [Parvularcula lutaonensis]GGY37485.1 UPF0102 protein R00337 [Parvularcula lutaonensis]